MRAALIVAALLVGPGVCSAQIVDIELGGGYVFGGGVENPSPSLPVFDVGASVWPWQRWGIAVRLVEGPGEDLYDSHGTGSGERTFLGQADLHYWAVAARRRWTLTDRAGFELGFGMALDGRFSNVVDFQDPTIGRQTHRVIFFETLLIEGYFTRAIGQRFAVKTGLSFDTNAETSNLQPLVLGAIRVF